ncbi:hypothetical protein QYF36_024189 [Acer negundo]|nr:hypothetical protein QYF36_024189 [Acer negundo]
MYVSKNMTYEELVAIVYTIVKYDVNKFIVHMSSISIVLGSTCHIFIRNDNDIQFMLREGRMIPQYNEQNNEQNNDLNHEVDNEANNEHVDDLENVNAEPTQIQTRRRRVQGVSCTALDMPRTSEVRHNVTTSDSDNATTWVIPGADSYSFGIGRSSTLAAQEPTSMIYKVQFFPSKKDLKRLVGFFSMRENFE